MKFSYFKNKKANRGFTLVESIVAIAIFTASVVVLIVVLSNGIDDTNYAKKKITAGYLAQEGIEYIRNMRDTYVVYPQAPDEMNGTAAWNDFNTKLANASCDQVDGCYFSAPNLFINGPRFMTEIDMNPCPSGVCPNLLYIPSTGEYQYVNPGVDSGFSRKIKVTMLNSDETRVSSTVYWRQNSGIYSVTLSEDLFNWVE